MYNEVFLYFINGKNKGTNQALESFEKNEKIDSEADSDSKPRYKYWNSNLFKICNGVVKFKLKFPRHNSTVDYLS